MLSAHYCLIRACSCRGGAGSSFAWFARLGWTELWRWSEPAGFGAVRLGKTEIFLCGGGQGGRGKGANTSTFATWEDEKADKGCWMRMHIGHPDGHVFRVGNGIEETPAP